MATREVVKIVTSDDKEYVLPRLLLNQSKTIKSQLEELPSGTEVPLPNISSVVFDTIVKFLEIHQGDKEEDVVKSTTPDPDYVENKDDVALLKPLSVNDLCEVIQAANYLDIPQLLHACIRNMASRLKGKTTEQMREITGVQNDFTPAEYAALLKETEFCDDNEKTGAAASSKSSRRAQEAEEEEEEEEEAENDDEEDE